jgi:hypothetical protein
MLTQMKRVLTGWIGKHPELSLAVALILLPIIKRNMNLLIALIVCGEPGFSVSDRLGINSDPMRFIISAIWGFWLFSILWISKPLWRPVYWVGVLGFLTSMMWTISMSGDRLP